MIRKIVGLYYSPAGRARRMTEMLAKDIADILDNYSSEEVSFECHDLSGADAQDIVLDEEEVAVIGMPVYMGKIPLPAAEALRRVKGHGTMTLAAVSYGGRSYGNALYELQRCIEQTGLRVIGAGAFLICFRSAGRSLRRGEPLIDTEALDDFGSAVSNKIKRLSGSEVESLRIKPAPVNAPGCMPVHLVSRFSPGAAAIAQSVCERLAFRRRSSEWFL